MNKQAKRWLSIILVIALCFGIGPIIKLDLKSKAEESDLSSLGGAVSDATSSLSETVIEAKNQYYTFGTYPLWDDNENTYVPNPLKWRVLSEDDDYYTLIMDHVVFIKAFGRQVATTSWEESSIREFLNGSFYSEAFTDSQKKDIVETNIEFKGFDESIREPLLEDWSDWNVRKDSIIKEEYEYSGSVKDKVFILSAEDYMNQDYGFSDTREETESRIMYMDEKNDYNYDYSYEYPTMNEPNYLENKDSQYYFYIDDNNYGAIWVWTRDVEEIDLLFGETCPTAINPRGALHSGPYASYSTGESSTAQNYGFGKSSLDTCGIQPVIRVKKDSNELKPTSRPNKAMSTKDESDEQNEAIDPNENSIRVYPNNKNITMLRGTTIHLGFELIKNGKPSTQWNKKTISISNPDAIYATDDEKNSNAYNIIVKAFRNGTSYLTVSDAESGLSTTLEIEVVEFSEAKMIPIRKSFGTQTINGIVFDNYWFDYDTKKKEYTIHIDAYNWNYYSGAIDIFDKNNNWLGAKEIKKFAIPSKLYEVKDEVLYLIKDSNNGKKGSYRDGNETQFTRLEFKVPQGGYFTISNNYIESEGTWIYNTIDLVFDLIKHIKSLFKGSTTTSDAAEGTIKKRFYEKFIENSFEEIDIKNIKRMSKNVIKKSIKSTLTKQELYDSYTGIFKEFINTCNLIDFKPVKEFEHTVFNIAEDALDFVGGGLLKKGFDVFDFLNFQACANQLARSLDYPTYTFYTEEYNLKNNNCGITVTQNNNPIPNVTVQAFRVYKDDSLKQYFSKSDILENSELYQISLVKDDQIVQPDKKVKVKIPIPPGMDKNSCTVYREESDGTLTKLDVHIENDKYVAFETDHFSLYIVTGEPEKLEIKTLPQKLNYSLYDYLDTNGLVLQLGDQTISDGFYCSPVFFSEEGDHEIIVNYGSAQTSFVIHVGQNGFVKDSDGIIRYYEGGKVDIDLTDVKYDSVSGNWYNVVKGCVTPGPTVANNSNGWWYIDKEGKVVFTANGIYKNAYGWWKTTDGKVTFNQTGIFKNEYGWWRVVNSKVDFNANGIYKNDYGWWKTTKGKVTFDETGVFKNDYGWWRVEKSKVNFNSNGVFKNEYGWWYVKDGKVDFNYTGVAKNEYGWWRIEKGKVNFKFNGIAKNENGTWYIEKGKVNFKKNGKVKFDGKTYKVTNGKAKLA